MRRTGILWAVCALAALAAGLGYAVRAERVAAANGLPELVELAPADAMLVAYADLQQLRNSPLIERLGALARPARVDRDYARFVGATGFDYRRDLDTVVLAERSSGNSDTIVVFAEGRFHRDKIEQYALRSGTLRQENGRAVYVMPSTTPGKKISLAFLSGNRLALEDGGDLAADLPAAGTKPLDPGMRERLSRVAGAPLFAAVKVSAFLNAAPARSAGAGDPSALFQSVRWVSLAARPDGDEMYLSAEGECGSAAEARDVAGALDLMRTLLRGGLENPKARGPMSAQDAAAASGLLQAMHITTEAGHVRLLLDVTPEMLRFPRADSPASR
jgi:hypothetical protein